MITTKFIVREDKNNSLRLRITAGRQKCELALGFNVDKPTLANILSSAPAKNNLHLAQMLDVLQAKVDSIRAEYVIKGIEPTLAEFKDRVLTEVINKPTKPKGCFVDIFKEFADSHNESTKELYYYSLRRIEQFDKYISTRSIDEIGIPWLTRFESWLAQTNSKNARNILLRNIRAVFNYALDCEYTTNYPFRRFKIRPEATRKRAMTVEQLRSLAVYPVEDYQEFYRDMFVLMFCLIGINVVDLYSLGGIIDGRVEYRRAKTHRLYSIKVEPEAQAIIDKYHGTKNLLCIADRWTTHSQFGKQMNKALKRMGEMQRVGRGGKKVFEPIVPGLTTYWARHTWATIAASLDVPKETIAHALGHGNDTVTDIYIDFDKKKVDEANRKVLDFVFGK